MSQKRYAYLIGANGPQTEHLATLKYAEKDAQRLAEALSAAPCAFTKAEWTRAENPQPTLAGLNLFMRQCGPSDLLLVHFSGHGNYEGQLFLVCNSTDIDDCISSAIKVSDIKAYLDKCKARHKVLVLDCCHAGGAFAGAFKGDGGIQSTLQTLGSSCVILSACSRAKTTRELEALDGGEGAGFLSWALTAACTSRFQQVSPDGHALSLMDIWRWVETALEEANASLKPEEEKLHLPILVNEMTPGHDGEIWLTEQRWVHTNTFMPDELTRKKYLQSVYNRYSSVRLPLGPEGFSLNAIFQPLELRRDPLAAEDLDRQKRRSFLGERLQDEKDADHFSLERGAKARADEKQRPVIAEHGEDALAKSPQRRVVILGGPGSGKTTTLKHFIGCRANEALTDPKAPVPIFLSLADLARSQKTLQSYLVDLVEELGIERSYAESLWKAIKAGQAFVCLDSLDEVEPQRRQKMIEWVNEWAAESGNTWVIGSRFSEYKGGSFKHGQFAEWELLPMNHQLRLELAERLLPELQRLLPDAPERSLSPVTFVQLLEDHPQAAAWGENPLLFSLAAAVFLRTGGLPSSRAMLYREVIDAVLETREKNPVRRKVLRCVLSDLALELYKAKGRTFSLDDLLALLPIIRQRQHENWETEKIADRIVTSGMLDVLAHETYSFRHQTFQEYLAAVELAQRLTHQNPVLREDAWKLAWSKRTYSRWTEILRLMVGALSQLPGTKGKLEAQHWLQELIEQRSTEEGDPGDLGLALALKSLAEITKRDEWGKITIVQLQQNIISIWFDELLKAARGQRKAKQARLQSLARDIFHLSGREVDEVLKRLVKTLWDHNENVRYVADNVLAELAWRLPAEALLQALRLQGWWGGKMREVAREVLEVRGEMPWGEQDHNENVRYIAGNVVVELAGHVPVEALLQALRHRKHAAGLQVLGGQGERVSIELLLEALHDESEYVRHAAVRVLGKQGERVPVDALLKASHDESAQVRYEAVQALGTQGERVPIELLLEALHDESAQVRQAAVQVLGGQGERIPIELLLEALHHKTWQVRQAAVQVLGKQGERVPIELLLEALHDETRQVRYEAVQVLGKQGERVPVDALLDALHDKDTEVRQAAVQVLGKQGEHVPIELLLDALHDENWQVRYKAVQVLGKQGERVPVDALLKALHDENWEVQLEAQQVLRERVPIELLLEALHHKSRYVREVAVEVLVAQGERVPIELLLEALHHKDWEVRQAAMQVLGEHVPVDALLETLHDESNMVRLAAVQVLEAQGERVPVDALLEALHDESNMVRLAAVQVLGAQGERVPVDALLKVLHDRDKQVQLAAVEVLEAQGERVPIELLLEALHEYWEVRQAAVQVLGAQGERVPIELLLEALHDEDWEVQQAAVQVLGAQEERVPVEAPLETLHDPDADIRRAAVQALGAQGEHVPIEPLLEALHDEHEFVRRAAVAALGKQGERVPIELLLEALHDGNWKVRQAAVQVLGAQGERVPINALLEALHDGNWKVRQAAVQVQGEQGERVPIEPLLEVLHDEHESVRRAAVEALGKQGERVPIEPLLEDLRNEHGYVRRAAVEALGGQGERVPIDHFLEAVGDEDKNVRREGIKVLSNRAPDVLFNLTNEAIAILNRQPASFVLGSIVQTSFCKLVGELKLALPVLLDELAELLSWPHWQVRTNAARALGSIRRNIPDAAIRHLLELRRHDPVRVVREAADDALAEILSLETGIEDD